MAAPTLRSLAPFEYEGAVSRYVQPASSARRTISTPCASSGNPPSGKQPSPNTLTLAPVLPKPHSGMVGLGAAGAPGRGGSSATACRAPARTVTAPTAPTAPTNARRVLA